MSSSVYDVIVLGAGPGGYVAAIRAGQLGLKTAIIEAQHLGGVCLNWGCIPTKTLLRTAEIYHTIQRAQEFGLKVSGVEIDLPAVIARSRQVSEQLTKGIRYLLKKNKVEVIEGWGSVRETQTGNHRLSVRPLKGEELTLNARHVIIATGAKARLLSGFEPDGSTLWTAAHAMTPSKLPHRMLIIGSGAIGVEFASFYNALGTKVTIVELQNRILPQEDEEIAAFAQKSFEKQGIKIITGTQTNLISKEEGAAKIAFLKEGKKVEETFDVVLPAIGVEGNTSGFGLELTKVRIEKNQIVTHDFCETDEPGIYAIGDVASAPWLAHKASHEGVLVAETIAGHHPKPLDYSTIAGCTYSFPQIASVGLTEAKANTLEKEVKVGRFPFNANGKALALGETEGLVKVIFDGTTGELLGAHMIGAEVTELIQGFVLAKTAELTEQDFMHTVFPHPTLSEMMAEAVLDAFGKVIHA